MYCPINVEYLVGGRNIVFMNLNCSHGKSKSGSKALWQTQSHTLVQYMNICSTRGLAPWLYQNRALVLSLELY